MNKDIINEYYLERYALGELPEEEEKNILRLASNNPEIKAALDKIEQSNQNILSLYPASNVLESLHSLSNHGIDKKDNRRFFEMLFFPSSKRILTISSACTAVLLLFFFFILPNINRKPIINPYDVGQDFSLVKGISSIDLTKTQLLVFRKNNDEIEVVDSGTLLNKGDILQLAYVAADNPYGIILSIDGRGTLTLHFPEEKNESTELILNKRSLLPHAMELDDAPHFERFFFITSKNKINVEDVLILTEYLVKNPARVRESELDLPEGMDQYSVLILKGDNS
ncbi:hypothetical protein ACFLRX_02345 [Acidobacteriota bacterium]